MSPPLIQIDTPTLPPAAADVVIIGGGIIGIFAGYYLARRGVSVAVIEKGRIGAEQSSRNWGWCRQQNRDERELPMASKAIDLWERFGIESGEDTGFNRCGLLYLSNDEEEIARWAAWGEFAKTAGVTTHMLDSRAASMRGQITGRRWKGGVFSPTDGTADPGKAAPAVARAIMKLGGSVVQNCAVRGLEVEAGRVSAVITESGVIKTRTAVLAGGAWASSNFLARAYQQVPIAITVEGANILTRCLIIFGQGAIRCHPYVLKELAAAADEDRQRALQEFDRLLFAHLSFVAANAARSLVGGLSGGWLLPASRHAGRATRSYVRAVVHLSSAFALLTDVSMGVLGGTLKFRERISARLGDVLSQLYLVSAVLKRFEDEGRQEADLPYVDWSVQDALNRAQEALIEVLHNFPNPFIAFLLRGLIFPLGRPYRKPSDVLGTRVAKAMQTPGESRNRLLADAYLPREGDPLACGEQAFVLTPVVQQLEHRLKQDIKDGRLPPMPQNLPELPAWSALALERSLISAQEKEALDTFAHYAEQSVRVDDFAADFDRAEMLASQR